MPENTVTNPLKLAPETRKRLTTLKEDIDRANAGIAVMKKIGMSTKELEDKMKWAESTRDILLKEFG